MEFLVAERLVPPLPIGGAETIDESRAKFNRTQLRAAIRRDPEAALQALRDFGHID